MQELDFVHEFAPGNSERTLLLLRGTGGDEHDLIPLGRHLASVDLLFANSGHGLVDADVQNARAWLGR